MNKPFRFKQFSVNDNHASMKVGTDGVLIGIFANVQSVDTVLDVGTGSGLIALIVAQRSNACIHAIDIDPASIEQAKENFSISPWNDRIVGELISIQSLSKDPFKQYDLIVSNPPFFSFGIKPKSEIRSQTRHTDCLSHDDLLAAVRNLLKSNGRFEVILPSSVAAEFKLLANSYQLFLNRILFIVPVIGKEPNRVLMSFSRLQTNLSSGSLCIQDKGFKYTDEFKSFAKDFYLEF